MLQMVVLTFMSVGLSDPDHSNELESYWAALSYGVLFVALYKMALAFTSVDQSLQNTSRWKRLRGSQHMALTGLSFIMMVTFKSV